MYATLEGNILKYTLYILDVLTFIYLHVCLPKKRVRFSRKETLSYISSVQSMFMALNEWIYALANKFP